MSMVKMIAPSPCQVDSYDHKYPPIALRSDGSTYLASILKRTLHLAPLSFSRQPVELSILVDHVHLVGHEGSLLGPLWHGLIPVDWFDVIDRPWQVSCGREVHGLDILFHKGQCLWSLCSWRWRRGGCLALASATLLLATSSCHRGASGLRWRLLVVVDPPHVVEEVVSPWKSSARNATVTASILAQMWPVTMPMHAVCFSFMSEQTCGGRELLLGTSLDLAAKGLQVRINELARETELVSKLRRVSWG